MSDQQQDNQVKQETSGTEQYTFPRAVRLLTPADYRAVFADGRRFGDRYWTILVAKSRNSVDNRPRLGLAIAKKRVKKSTDRNRLKRIARETFRYSQHDITGLDLVIMCRDGSATVSQQEITRSLQQLFGKIVRYRHNTRTER